jgi:hypothetical protein
MGFLFNCITTILVAYLFREISDTYISGWLAGIAVACTMIWVYSDVQTH